MSGRYHLKDASDVVGVSPVTLKRWLLSGKVGEVQRDRNGWRVFYEDDIRRIKAFAESETPYNAAAGSATALADCETAALGCASFFSGIGGFELGFEQAGFRTTFQCEIDPFCADIIAQHWPTVERRSDIREVSSDEIPVSDVWTGGFPCQDVSLARMGKREGLRGRKSGLFYEFARLLGERRPRVVVVENVPGLLSSHGGKDFAIVLSTLAELGYSVGWRTLNSKNFGVPQSRQRVFIVGCRRDPRGPGAILFEPQRGEGDTAPRGSDGKEPVSAFKEGVGDISGEGPVVQSIAYCLYACSARHTGTDWSRTYVSYPKQGRVRRLTPKECEGVMGFPEGWTIPRHRHENGEDLDTLRYQALGNAVTPPVAWWIARRVKAYLEEVG